MHSLLLDWMTHLTLLFWPHMDSRKYDASSLCAAVKQLQKYTKPLADDKLQLDSTAFTHTTIC